MLQPWLVSVMTVGIPQHTWVLGNIGAARRLGVQFVWCLSLFETALPLKVQVETYRQPDQSEPGQRFLTWISFYLKQFLSC